MAKTAINTWQDYNKATADASLRTIWMASGEVGSGKTRFGLTGPSPILVQSLDMGTEGVVEQVLKEFPDKQIYIKEYDWDPSTDFSQQKAVEIRDAIVADFMFGLKNARTILWDKETDIREVFQYAEFGGPTDGNIKDYAKLNARYFHLINTAKKTPGVNFGLFQAMKDEWMIGDSGKVNPTTGEKKKSFNKTGKRIRAGFERLDELVMTEMHFVRHGGEFSIEIGKCRQNTALQDKEFGGMTFSDFGQLLIDGTEAGDWE